MKTKKASIKLKGYKKFVKRIRRIHKEINQLNRELKKSVELKERLF